MSLDLYIHCKSSRRITTEQLSAELAARGIHAAIFVDYLKCQPADAGPIQFCTILGWQHGAIDFARLTETLSGGDRKQLSTLFEKEVLAYANVTAMDGAAYYENFGEDYIDSLAGEIDQQFLDFLSESKTVYEIQTSAGRSDFSWRFQIVVCCALAELAEGLIEDPQLGNYFFPRDAEEYFRSE